MPGPAIHADHQSEPAGPAGRDAGERVLDDDGRLWGGAELFRRGEEEVGCRLARETPLGGQDPIGDDGETVAQPRGDEYVTGVARRRHHRGGNAGDVEVVE